jgi:transposase
MEYSHNFYVIQVDNGRFHLSSKLKIPENVLLIFQPPYSPDLNPIERVWHYIKPELSWGNYDNLDALKEKVRTFIE